MARGRVTSFDQDLLLEPPEQMDGLLASSWPRPAPSLMRPRMEPPRAPLRKPSDVDWEVPPLQLPTGGPTKRSSSADGSSTTREDADGQVPATADEDDDDEEEDACVFAFEGGGAGGMDDEEDDQFQLELVGLDDAALDVGLAGATGAFAALGGPLGVLAEGGAPSPEGGSPASSGHGRSQSFSASPQLGASPVLLSALERVAAEAGVHNGGGSPNRHRFGTF